MKKITIVMKSSWMDDVLHTLGELGVLHLHPVNPSENNIIVELREKIWLLEKVFSIIPERKENKISSFRNGFRIKSGIKLSEYNSNQNLVSSKTENQIGFSIPVSHDEEESIVFAKTILDLREDAKHLKQEIEMLEIEYERVKVWGKFDPEEMNRLRASGILVKLFRCHKKELRKIRRQLDIQIISQNKSTIYFAVVSTDKDAEFPLEEIPVPLHDMEETERMIKKKRVLLLQIQNKISNLYRHSLVMKRTLLKLVDKLHYEEAKAGLGREEDVSYLVGFCPLPLVESLRKIAEKNGWVVLIEDPLFDEPVPTLLRHSRWTGIFQPVMNFIGVTPGYREFDTNGIFLIFFSIFFAMIMGDGGYGIVLLSGTFLVDRCYKLKSRELVHLFYLISMTTIIWGAVTGLWFGVEALSHLPILREAIIPSFYTFSRESGQGIMHLSIFIGAIQLSIARMYTAIKQYPSLTLFAEAGWVSLIWGIYFIARCILLHEKLNNLVFVLIGFWVIMLILFGEQRDDGLMKGILRGMAKSLFNVLAGIGSFSDLISYIRLFAVGLATKEIALAFNNMAGDVGFNDIVSIIIAVFIIIFGHSINIVLGAMSVLVHGIRLNLLEFSKNLSIQWSGIVYSPFIIKRSQEL